MNTIDRKQLRQLTKSIKAMVRTSKPYPIKPLKQTGPIRTNYINGRPAEEFDNWRPQKDGK
jgi:hypothetical protein